MKAMILAAGRGERMRPLTDTLPKPLLEVGGKRLIEYHIEALQKIGVTDIVVNTAWLGEKIPELIGDGARYGVSITYSPETEALETGGGIFKALPLLSDEAFIVVNADVWTDFPFEQLLNREVDAAHLILVENPAHNLSGDFAIDGDLLCSEGEQKYTYSGIGIYHPRFFAHCSAGRFPLAPMLREWMNKGAVSGQLYSGRWNDIGTPERLKALDETLSVA